MASIREIARYADVPVDSVMRVLNKEPVSADVAARVERAMDALHGVDARPSGRSEPRGGNGAGDEHPVIEGVAAEPAAEEESAAEAELPEEASADPEVEPAVEQARAQMVESIREATLQLETLPQGVGDVVHEALRSEVQPVSEQVEQLGALFRDTLKRIENELRGERGDRVDDLALLVDLITTSWRTVDRRLGRIERKLERMERGSDSGPASRVVRVDEPASERPSDER